MKIGSKKTVLFICKHNSARSQMAEGLLNSLKGQHYKTYSAGTEPTKLSSYAVEVMAEKGIDISMNRSKSLDDFKGMEFDYVVTVCEGDTCPYFPYGKKHMHKSFKDPSSIKGDNDTIIKAFTQIRDEIEQWLKETF